MPALVRFNFSQALLRLVIVVALLLNSFCVHADDAAQPKDCQAAYKELLAVDYFSFGGVGIGGTTSPGETCFKTIATSPDGLQLFKSALTNGTTESKLYALCGIRKLAPTEFNSAAAPIIAKNPPVNLMSGCIASSIGSSNVVAQIKNGVFDLFVNTP